MEEAIKRAAGDLVDSAYAIALTGAGMSTESGIPDFRGPSGVWTKNPERERLAYQGYERFLEDPKAYWKERLTTPSVLGNLEASKPNNGHYAQVEMETLGVLNRHVPSFGAWHHHTVDFVDLKKRHPFGCRGMKTELI